MASDIDTEGNAAQRKSAASRAWLIAKYALSVLLIAYLAISVEWPKVWASMRTVSVPWLLSSLLSIPAGIVIIALRYRDLIDRLISLRAMLHLVVFQGAISTFLANAAGSLSYIGILIKVYKVPAELAVQSTIIARLVDMFASLILVALLAALAWDRLGQIHSLLLLAMILAVAILAVAVVMVAITRRLNVPADAPVAQGLVPSLLQRMLNFSVSVIRLRPDYVASTVPRTVVYSLLGQFVIAVSMYCNVRAFHVDIGFVEAALVGVVSSFIASVPITVLGGLGVYEVSTVSLLAVFGVPIEASAAMILVVRTIFFLVMAIAFFVTRPPSE